MIAALLSVAGCLHEPRPPEISSIVIRGTIPAAPEAPPAPIVATCTVVAWDGRMGLYVRARNVGTEPISFPDDLRAVDDAEHGVRVVWGASGLSGATRSITVEPSSEATSQFIPLSVSGGPGAEWPIFLFPVFARVRPGCATPLGCAVSWFDGDIHRTSGSALMPLVFTVERPGIAPPPAGEPPTPCPP